MNNNLNYTKMKTKKMIFFFVFFCTLGVNAQQIPTCEGVDTTHWKRISTIPIDYGYRCIDVDYRKFYFINPAIKVYTHLNRKKNNSCNEYKTINFKNYNIISFSTRVGSCNRPFVQYSLFDTGTKAPFLKITLNQYGTCKNSLGVGFDCLVLKKYCPKQTKVCLLQHLIALKDND